MKNKKIVVAITQGDINGIGYETILKIFGDPEMLELCIPVVYGSPKIAAYHRKAMNLTTNFTTLQNAANIIDGRLNLIDCIEGEVKIELGQPSAESGQAALASLERAVADYKEGLFDVLVTAPINKASIQSDNFRFPGHTEYLQDRMGNSAQPLMIMLAGNLRVALATTHLPVSQIAQHITKDNITQKLRILSQSLKQDFNISNPRIAVLALNPHAGDDGLLGTEEKEAIIPAINELESQNILCFGPYPADGFFGSRAYEHFDGILAMYHDQGLAPFKTIAMENGINFTAGLPIIRTSPDHGTAYDIAGKGCADCTSMRQAIYAAVDIFRNRTQYAAAHANPLRKLYHERRDDSDKLKLNAPEDDKAKS